MHTSIVIAVVIAIRSDLRAVSVLFVSNNQAAMAKIAVPIIVMLSLASKFFVGMMPVSTMMVPMKASIRFFSTPSMSIFHMAIVVSTIVAAMAMRIVSMTVWKEICLRIFSIIELSS